MAWYKSGRVTINTGDTYITGINTRFASNARVGDAIRAPDGEWYEMINTSSETVIGIYPPYRGVSVVESTDYMIAPIQGYNKETADRLRFITDNIRDFTEDVNAAAASAAAAKASETAAAGSATAAKASEDDVAANAAAAALSEQNAKTSETNAAQSQMASSISEMNAKKSETNASMSETAAAASQVASATSAEEARLSAIAALASQMSAKVSEDAAKVSETNAKASETAADADATTANTDAATATQARIDALEAQRLAEKARDDAQAAANANTGQVQDLGLVDLSSGVYPARPVVSSFWYVSVGGTVTDNGETIEYGVSDVLRFSKPLEKFYKIDNTDAVTSVAGRTGVVVLDKNDVGLTRVDNTNDLEKPVSTAVRAELDARTVTVGRLDNTPNRIVKVGDYGLLGSNAIFLDATVDANTLTEQGLYVYPNNGINIPTSYMFLRQYNYSTAFTKQIGYDVASNAQWIRTKVNSSWSSWLPVNLIVDNLTSTNPNAALSANAGRLLQEQLQANNATIVQYNYKVVTGQLVITGNDLNGKNLSYTPGAALIVSLNGFTLLQGTDFTATTGTSVSLTRAIEADSEVIITVFGAFSVANHYTKSEADSLLSNVVKQSAEAVGTIKWVASRLVIPDGCLPLDGGVFSRATYPDLWALIGNGRLPTSFDADWLSTAVLRTSFTPGDNSSTFRLADYNGKSSGALAAVFLRGDGALAGNAGVLQATQNKPHTHPFTGAQYYSGQTGGTSSQYGTTASTTQVFPYNTSAEVGGGTAAESRPYNVAGVWVIRAFGSVANAGSIDAVSLSRDVAATTARVATLEGANQKIYMSRQIGNEHINPSGAGTVIHWGIGIAAKGCTYQGVGGGRGIVMPVAGTYRISVTLLCQGTVPATGVTLYRKRGAASVALTQTYSGNSGTTTTMQLSYLASFLAGDSVFTQIEVGTVLNTQDGGQYNGFIVERVDD